MQLPNSKKREKTKLQSELEEMTVSVIQQLNLLSKITSQSEVEHVLGLLSQLSSRFPTSVNLFVLQDLENDINYTSFTENYFTVLLEEVIRLFDHNFPFCDGKVYESVAQLFSIEESSFFEATLQVLVNNLKSKPSGVVGCLRILLESEALFSALVPQVWNSEENWKKTVNLVVSLPSRVANVLERETPQCFSNRQFSNMIFYNFLKSLEFVALTVSKDTSTQFKMNVEGLAQFLGSVIVNFNDRSNCDGLHHLVDIMALLTNKPSTKLVIYQKLWYKILESLDRTAVEVLAKTCLTRISPEKYLIKNLFGKELVKLDAWKYMLCTKIPLLTFIEDNQTNLVTNLVLYLGSVAHSELVQLLLNLVTIWSDKFSIKRTSVEHHLLISKFIVCIINCLKQIGLTKHEKTQLKSKVYHGLPAHLESAVDAVKYSGMKTGEIVVNFIHEDDSSDNLLKFDYSNMNEVAELAVNKLKHFNDLNLSQLYQQKSKFECKVDDLLEKLHHRNEPVIQYDPPARQLRQSSKTPNNEVILSEYVKSKSNYGITVIDPNMELDSDDEFEPYDVSNDVKLPDKPPPAYLRDLRDSLIETDDPDVFAAALSNCQKLVMQQLPDDDASIGLELMEILISLDSKFYVENFNQLVFESCLAITCVYPAFYADYLCKEVHADVGKYSIVHRVLMLDILKEAAKTLSSLTASKTSEEPKTKKPRTEITKASEVIKKRLESKTRYFHTHKVLKHEQRNKFADVAGHFFFPLLYGYNQNKLLSQQLIKDNDDFLLLIHFIETLAVVMFCAQNCNIATRMAKEALHFSWFLRFHKDVKVRMAVLNLIAAAVLVVPQAILIADFMNELFEIRLWLADLLNPNVSKGEPNTECRHLAVCTITLIENVLKIDADDEM